MYVVSQKDINLLLTKRTEYNDKYKSINDSVVDIENFRSIKSLTIFMLEIVLPNMCLESKINIQFFDKRLKPILDRILKKYGIRFIYNGMNHKTRSYTILP